MSTRNKGLDLYRILACAFVIINHCNSKVMIQVAPKSLAWYVTVGVIFITKICVPGFFMITGFNLLHRKEDLHTYLKRIVRITVVLVVFSIFYYLWRDQPHSVLGFLQVLFCGTATDAFWYLYTYLGIMIMMPVYQIVAGHISSAVSSEANNKDRQSASAVFAVIACISVVFVVAIPSVGILAPGFALSKHFQLPMICIATVYLFTGHFFRLYSEKIGAGKGIKARDMLLVLVFAAGFGLNMILSAAEYRMTGGTSWVTFSDIYTVGMVMESVAAFMFFVKIRGDKTLGKVIGVVAPTTFGIYLLADFMSSVTHMVYFELCRFMNRLAAVAVQEAVAYVLAFVVIFGLRLIPGVKKWV